MRKVFGVLVIVGLMLVLSTNLSAEENIVTDSENKIENQFGILVSLTPVNQSVRDAERANWTLRGSHEFGREPIVYTLYPGDGSRYVRESFDSNVSFNHRYYYQGSFRTYNVKGTAAFIFGYNESYGTVSWYK